MLGSVNACSVSGLRGIWVKGKVNIGHPLPEMTILGSKDRNI